MEMFVINRKGDGAIRKTDMEKAPQFKVRITTNKNELDKMAKEREKFDKDSESFFDRLPVYGIFGRVSHSNVKSASKEYLRGKAVEGVLIGSKNELLIHSIIE